MTLLDDFASRTDQTYYKEVGQRAMLTAAETRKLLVEYHTCPHCDRPWPRQVKTKNCTECGTIIPHTSGGKSPTCTTCFVKIPTQVIPKACPHCGSGRAMEPRKRLIEGNLRFVMRTARRFTNEPRYLRKLISAGNVGLVVAVDRFDISRSSTFLTYAAWWIKKEMLDEMSAASSPVHIPAYLQKDVRKQQKQGAYVCINCGIRSQDAHGHSKLPECCDKKHDFTKSVHPVAGMLSSPAPIDGLELRTNDDTFSEVLEQRTGRYLRNILASMQLNQRDYFIVLGFFDAGAGDRKSGPKKLPQLSEITGITTERVRQVKEKVLDKLRDELRRRNISEVGDAY